jgi:hypothetical protein
MQDYRNHPIYFSVALLGFSVAKGIKMMNHGFSFPARHSLSHTWMIHLAFRDSI